MKNSEKTEVQSGGGYAGKALERPEKMGILLTWTGEDSKNGRICQWR